MEPIVDVAEKIGIPEDKLERYGRDRAKVDLSILDAPRPSSNAVKTVLVTAITPTPAGEGKTTTSIGLSDAMSRLGHRVCVALREPSLGPVFGIKGGGTGGGKAQLTPMERINLHFNGDFHAVTSAHNLLAATIDNHLHFGNALGFESRRILWPRVIDMNDRALRNCVVGLGGNQHSIPRQNAFDITAASELMAMLCLSTSFEDLRKRIDRTLIGFTRDRKKVLAGELNVTGSMLALMQDCLKPNLVQTLEGTPALVHGGPFANIAHGCNSVLATRMAQHLSDWVITEAGFGCDLGAEKFFDIKCRAAGVNVNAVVVVASVRALKMHGGRNVKELDQEDVEATRKGLVNLEKHLENVRQFGKQPIVSLNRFAQDTDAEVAVVEEFCKRVETPCAVATHFVDGGAGAEKLAKLVTEHATADTQPINFMYELSDSVEDKIRKVAQKVYGADDVVFAKDAQRDLKMVAKQGYTDLPVCIAKTQNSLSDDPTLRGRPKGFTVTVRNIQINSGAGFLVVLTGDILRMPGLPRKPQAENITLEGDTIVGLR